MKTSTVGLFLTTIGLVGCSARAAPNNAMNASTMSLDHGENASFSVGGNYNNGLFTFDALNIVLGLGNSHTDRMIEMVADFVQANSTWRTNWTHPPQPSADLIFPTSPYFRVGANDSTDSNFNPIVVIFAAPVTLVGSLELNGTEVADIAPKLMSTFASGMFNGLDMNKFGDVAKALEESGTSAADARRLAKHDKEDTERSKFVVQGNYNPQGLISTAPVTAFLNVGSGDMPSIIDATTDLIEATGQPAGSNDPIIKPEVIAEIQKRIVGGGNANDTFILRDWNSGLLMTDEAITFVGNLGVDGNELIEILDVLSELHHGNDTNMDTSASGRRLLKTSNNATEGNGRRQHVGGNWNPLSAILEGPATVVINMGGEIADVLNATTNLVTETSKDSQAISPEIMIEAYNGASEDMYVQGNWNPSVQTIMGPTTLVIDLGEGVKDAISYVSHYMNEIASIQKIDIKSWTAQKWIEVVKAFLKLVPSNEDSAVDDSSASENTYQTLENPVQSRTVEGNWNPLDIAIKGPVTIGMSVRENTSDFNEALQNMVTAFQNLSSLTVQEKEAIWNARITKPAQTSGAEEGEVLSGFDLDGLKMIFPEDIEPLLQVLNDSSAETMSSPNGRNMKEVDESVDTNEYFTTTQTSASPHQHIGGNSNAGYLEVGQVNLAFDIGSLDQFKPLIKDGISQLMNGGLRQMQETPSQRLRGLLDTDLCTDWQPATYDTPLTIVLALNHTVQETIDDAKLRKLFNDFVYDYGLRSRIPTSLDMQYMNSRIDKAPLDICGNFNPMEFVSSGLNIFLNVEDEETLRAVKSIIQLVSTMSLSQLQSMQNVADTILPML